MSHFSVLVLTNSCTEPDEALAPFSQLPANKLAGL